MPPRLPLPLLAAAMAEGAGHVTVYVYGPLFLRQVLGESRFTIVALSMGLSALATFIMANVWGRWGDRKGLSLGLVAAGMSGAVVTLAAMPLMTQSWLFILLAIFSCAALAVVAPLGVAWATAAELKRQGREIARFYRFRSAGWALGSFGCSFLLRDSAGAELGVVFQFSAALVLAASLWLFLGGLAQNRVPARALAPADDRPAASGSSGVDVPETSDSIWRQPIVTAMALMVLLSLGGNEAFVSLLGPYFTEHLHGPAAWIGLGLGVASVVGVLATGIVGRLVDRRGPVWVLMIGVTGYIAVYGLMAAFRHPVVAIVLFAVPLYPFIATGVTGTLARQTPLSRRGEAMGVFEGSAALASTIGSLTGGVVVDALGLAALPVWSFLLATAGLAVAWTRVLRRLRAGASVTQSD